MGLLSDVTTIIFITIENGLLVHEIIHGLVALPFAVLFWKTSLKWKRFNKDYLIFVLLFVTFFMDLDHFIDYWTLGGIRINLVEFFSLNYFSIKGFALVPFHAWEYVIILFFLARRKNFKSYMTPIFLGMIPHLIWDAYNVKSFFFYSIIYRITTGFSLPN